MKYYNGLGYFLFSYDHKGVAHPSAVYKINLCPTHSFQYKSRNSHKKSTFRITPEAAAAAAPAKDDEE